MRENWLDELEYLFDHSPPIYVFALMYFLGALVVYAIIRYNFLINRSIAMFLAVALPYAFYYYKMVTAEHYTGPAPLQMLIWGVPVSLVGCILVDLLSPVSMIRNKRKQSIEEDYDYLPSKVEDDDSEPDDPMYDDKRQG